MAAAIVDLNSALNQIELEVVVTGRARAKLRLWLAAWLFRFAGLVSGMTVVVTSPNGRRSRATIEGVPLRSSIHDRDFDPALGRRLLIRLDGEEQTKVIGYDLLAGTIERHVTDAAGNIRLNEARTEILTETVSGRVEIELKPAADAKG